MARIGHYELRELLGEGGIGRVYAGYDTVLQREVAIKSLRTELLSDSNFLARFRAEATSLARLNHPNITTVHALVSEGRNLYMVMERVHGETLEDLLKRRNGPLGVREALPIIAQAADGLSYAHSMGVIHRDIKPANLMITEGGLVKIMDFGIARARGSQRLTRDGSIVGTLAYMAPEQLRGEPGDERSDLYSLAIVLYEVLAGTAPFSGTSDYELMQAQIHGRPAPLASVVPGVAGRIERALMKALAKKPEQRFASCREFKDALGASSSGPHAAPSALNDEIATDHGMSIAPLLASVGWRGPMVAAAVIVAVVLAWGLFRYFSDSGTSSAGLHPPPPLTSPSGGSENGSYGAAATSKEPAHPAIKPPPPGHRGMAPVVLPPPQTGTAPPPSILPLPRQQ
jgi:serine/threonine protein kinase